MSRFGTTLLAATLFALAPIAGALAATDATPVGTWRTIDDDTGKPKAIVEISQVGNELQGKVVKVLQSDDGPHPMCKKCDGKRHNQPVEGMTILWGMQHDDDQWDGGHILDPHNGKVYKCKMSLADDGQTLNVRGYIGFALLGRTQQWQRVNPPPAPAKTSAPAAPATAPVAPATAPAAAATAPAPGTPNP